MNALSSTDDIETDRHYRQIGRVIRFLSENYLDQPDLEQAAGVACLSPHHFQRLFLRYVEVSPKSFVSHLTLTHAKIQLAAGASILDAALNSGLSGSSRLHDLCVKIEAMTPGDYAKGGAGVNIDYAYCPCPFGIALIMATQKGVCGLAFADEGNEGSALADMKARWPRAEYRKSTARIAPLADLIFSRTRNAGRPLALHLLGTPWQIKVWEALLSIPEGQISTYQAVARMIANENSARAVGTAMGRNPISFLIPCHRVLGSDGTLHGYHWGLVRKRAMLAIEAARAGA